MPFTRRLIRNSKQSACGSYLNGEIDSSMHGHQRSQEMVMERLRSERQGFLKKGLAVTEKLKSPSGPLPKHKQRDARVAIEPTVVTDDEQVAKKVVRRGRPPLGEKAKGVVTIRLDADVLESYRGMGAGWQTRINADLRRARKLKKSRPVSNA